MSDSREKKRKRENAEPARKKVKKHKSEVGKLENDTELKEVAAPIAKKNDKKGDQTPEVKDNSSKVKKKKKSKASKADTPNAAVAADDNNPAKRSPDPSKRILSQDKSPEKLENNNLTKSSSGESLEKSKEGKKKHKAGEVVPHHKTSDAVSQKPEKNKKSKKKSKEAKSWSMSEPMGGWYLPQDPIFSTDEKSLIVANTRSLQIYSIETSLLTNSIPLGSGYMIAYALSSVDPKFIYTMSSEGRVTLWNWAEGKEIRQLDIEPNARRIAVVRQPQAEQDLVYIHQQEKRHIVKVYAICPAEKGVQMEPKQIFGTKMAIAGIQVFLEGKIVVVTTHKSVVVGKRNKLHKTALQDFEYTWREFQTSQQITCSNAFIRIPEQERNTVQTMQSQKDHIDLVIGGQDGVIYQFEDLLASLIKVENGQKEKVRPKTELEILRPKRLHWHREAVGSVKWSRDGNYLISGGDETVLVLWQLSTGKQQHLPHLTAAIENIVVSPSGTLYSVTLANNSVIVLSTSELEAKTNIIGIQSRRVDLERYPYENSPSGYSFDFFSQVPMLVDPKNANQILFTAPSSQPRHHSHGVVPETYLQSFDIASQCPVTRQALTRNNVTDSNVGPDGRRVLEPHVKFVQISSDGKWLATVDEWIPQQPDLGYIEEGIPEFNEEERTYRREVHLKFWRWDEKKSEWMLESRIDAPHFLDTVNANTHVLDLVADPSETGFATVGEDRFVRIWRPKTRLRNGIMVRGGDSDEGFFTWSLHRSIGLSSSLDILDSSMDEQALVVPQTVCLAFSPDGSVLAAGISFESEADAGLVYIIDSMAGTIQRSIAELDTTSLSCLGISGRYLIVVTDTIALWDLVADELVNSIPLGKHEIQRFDNTRETRLAINEEGGTFAIAWPFRTDDPSKARGARNFQDTSYKISVFDTHRSKSLWSHTVSGIVLSLVSAKDGPGYIALDSHSSIRIISPKARELRLIQPPSNVSQQLSVVVKESHKRDLEEEIREDGGEVSVLAGTEELLSDSENDKPVVRPEQLQEIFDVGPSHALPPVKDMFNAVVGLYAKRPRVVQAT